jgi:hypothetical protein
VFCAGKKPVKVEAEKRQTSLCSQRFHRPDHVLDETLSSIFGVSFTFPFPSLSALRCRAGGSDFKVAA